METFTVPGAADGVQLSTLVIAPESPKAVLQLVHGMAEHKERYIPFMNYLSEMGYACVICDLRGHGETVTDPKDLGWMGKGGMKALVDDVHCVTDWAKAQYPGLPFFLFGHSMGSMIVRSYLKRYDRDIDGLIVCGSPSQNPAAGLGDFLAGCISLFRGPRYRSQFLANLCTGNNDKKFKDDGIKNAWPQRPFPPHEGHLLPRGVERDETGPASPFHRRSRGSLHRQPEEILAGGQLPSRTRLSGRHQPGLSQDASRNPKRNRPGGRLA